MYKIVELENGLKIVMEHIPYVRSVSLGLWINCGSRSESQKDNGMSHFIEHMMFKGTEKRNAKQIAEDIDHVGGQLNAFTSKENTCYYVKALDTHLDLCIDIISDMIFNSKFDENDIEVERKVILEEINMYEDTPEELVYDMLYKTVWNDNPLGYPILGTDDTIKSFNKKNLQEFVHEYYTPCNSVIALVGNFKTDEAIDMIKQKFGNWKIKHGKKVPFQKANYKKGNLIKKKDIEQINVLMGFEGVQSGSNEVYDLTILNNILGGGMSSRLFQKIREEKGLVYSIYTSPAFYNETGLFTIYCGMNPGGLDEVIKLIKNELIEIKELKISEEQLEKTKEQLKGSYILGLESTGSRMISLGKSQLMLGYIKTQDEVLNNIDSVNLDSISKVIDKVIDFDKVSMSIVGNINKDYDLSSIF